jgi:hypothetical protein
MRTCLGILLLLVAGALCACRTTLPGATPGPLVRTPGATAVPAAPSGVLPPCPLWCCGPDRGRLVRRPWTLALEAGPLWTTRNDAAIPGDTGTRFGLDEVTGAGPFPWSRITLTARVSPRQEVRVLYAPLSIEETGRLDRDVVFRGRTFLADAPVTATYRFNSWRATWRYLLACGEDWSFKVGGTLKVRDAEVGLSQAGVRERKVDLGFVPLAHLAFEKRLEPRWRLRAELDGLAAPQGRAFDGSLTLLHDAHERWSVGLGYRTLEGGADNSDVYTFAWLHQVFLTVEARF